MEGAPGSQAPTTLCSEEWPGFGVKWKCAGWCLAVVEGPVVEVMSLESPLELEDSERADL